MYNIALSHFRPCGIEWLERRERGVGKVQLHNVKAHNEIVTKRLVIKHLWHIMKVSQNFKVTEHICHKTKSVSKCLCY
jgi:hypothetical protein